MNSEGVSVSARLEIVLEDKPLSRSVSTPAYVTNPLVPGTKDLYVCLGDSITMIDASQSTTTPIVDYYWESPWGVASGREYSFRAMAVGDNHILVHRVTNECGCYDEETIILHVSPSCPLKMNCYGSVCANSSVVYQVSEPTCGQYRWDIVGGTLLQGQGMQRIEVLWGAPESGYGTITLDASGCNCECREIKSVKISVISDAAVIEGPDVICKDEIVKYSLPLWGGTAYSWSVSPSTANIISGDSTNEMLLSVSQAGTYTLTAHYHCDFLHCGPYQVTKTIMVKDNLEIVTPQSSIVCMGQQVEFGTNATTGSSWIIKYNGTECYHSNVPAVNLNYTFTGSGFYTVEAVNAGYCNRAERVIEVPPVPPAPQNVRGPHEVCPGSSEYYMADATSDDYIILWEWDNGQPDLAQAVGERVMVTFDAGAADISVYQVDRRTGCRSEAVVWHTYPFVFEPWPYPSQIRVCEGQTFDLDLLPDHPDVPVLYEWKTPEPLAYTLTVVGDHLQRNVQVMTNYLGSVMQVPLYLTRGACGVVLTDAVTVVIGVIDPPVIRNEVFCSNTQCHLTVVSDEDLANADREQTYWEVDGVGVVRGLPAQVVFPHAGTYNVVLHYVSKYGCEATATHIFTVNDFPALELVESGGMLSVTGTGTGGFHYVWEPSAPDSQTIPTPTVQTRCTVCAPNGCCTTLTYMPPLPPCVQESGMVNVVHKCYNIVEVQLAAGVALPAKLSFLSGGVAVGDVVMLERSVSRLLVPSRLVNGIKVQWGTSTDSHCETVAMTPIESDCWLAFTVSGDCNGNIIIENQSACADPPVMQAEVSYYEGPTIYSAGLVDVVSVPAFVGSNQEKEFAIRISVGDDPNCYIEYIRLFGPQVLIRDLPQSMQLCVSTPAMLSATLNGCVKSVQWEFGDPSYNFGNDIYHTFSSGFHRVTLTVEGCNGCEQSGVINVDVAVNDISRNIQEDNSVAICFGNPKPVSYISQVIFPSPEYLYYWTPQVTLYGHSDLYTKRFDAYAGGDYRVLEVNPNNGCKGEATGNVNYPNEVLAIIRCKSAYCEGEEALAIGYASEQYHYQWRLTDGTGNLLESSTDANYRFTVPQGESCTLELVVTDNQGCTNSDTKTIAINSLPTAPAIAFGTNACITEGAVELSVPPLYRRALWSNGLSGYSTQYYTDGPASAYYVDAKGCRSPQGGITIPQAPDFGGLLTGCYPMCTNGTESTYVYTLGHAVGASWSWHRDGSVVQTGTVPPPPGVIGLNMASTGVYRLSVGYGQGCTAVSPELKMNPIDCGENHFGQVPANRVLSCVVNKVLCKSKGCGVEYTLDVTLSNMLSSAITVGSIVGTTPLVSTTPTMPFTVAAGGSRTLQLVFQYNFTTPPAVRLDVKDNTGVTVGTFGVDLSQSMECLNPDNCSDSVNLVYTLNTGQSVAGRVAYYDILCTTPSLLNQIIKVWCDGPGEMVSEISGNPYMGLFMIDYARLSQMVAAGETFCFKVLVCKEGTSPCVKEVCVNAEEMYEQCAQLQQGGESPKSAGGRTIGGVHYALQPNPTTGVVRVVDAASGMKAEGLETVAVLNMMGQVLVRSGGSGELDLSALPQGSYLVTVVGQKGEVEHLKLVKLQ